MMFDDGEHISWLAVICRSSSVFKKTSNDSTCNGGAPTYAADNSVDLIVMDAHGHLNRGDMLTSEK